MKKGKKFLALALSAAMLVSTVNLSGISVNARAQNVNAATATWSASQLADQTQEELSLDTLVQVKTDGKSSFSWVFTPDADGDYLFRVVDPSSSGKIGYDDITIAPEDNPDESESVSAGATTSYGEYYYLTATLEKGKRYIVKVAGENLAQVAEFSLEAKKNRTLERIAISTKKDTFAPGDIRNLAENLVISAIYTDGYETQLPVSLEDTSSMTDGLENWFTLETDGQRGLCHDTTRAGTQTLTVTLDSNNSIQASKEVTWGNISDFQYTEITPGEQVLDANKYYSFTVSKPAQISCKVKSYEGNREGYVAIYNGKGGSIAYSYLQETNYNTLLVPGTTYYLYAEDYDSLNTKVTVDLNAAYLPEISMDGQTIEFSEENERQYMVFTTGSLPGKYDIWMKSEDNPYYPYYEASVFDLNKNRVNYMEEDLQANTTYILQLKNTSEGKISLKLSLERRAKLANIELETDKKDFVAGMEGNFFSKIIFINDDGTRISSANAYRSIRDGEGNPWSIEYSMNDESEYHGFNRSTSIDTVGTMTIWLKNGYTGDRKKAGTVNIKPYDQVDIPVLNEGTNEDIKTFHLYKFVAPADGTAKVTISTSKPEDSNVLESEIYELAYGNFVGLYANSKLTAGETYYCMIKGPTIDEVPDFKVNLSFQQEKKLTGIQITAFDRPVYNLGADAMTDSLDMMKSALHYTLSYSDGTEEQIDAATDAAPEGVEVSLVKNGTQGLTATVSKGDIKASLDIPYTDLSSAPQLAIKNNKAQIDLTEAGQYVYSFKAPVTGYYDLSVVMPKDEYADCYYNFYKSTETAQQPAVDMSKRLVKAGETYYVCVYAHSKAQDINVVCTPAIKTVTLAKTSYTYDGKAKKPAVTVKDFEGKTIAASQYTVAYSNNTNIGTATVKVTLKGGYSNTVSQTFAINPAATSVTKLENTSGGVKITWKKSSAATGYTLYRSVNGGKYVKAATISKGSTVSYVDKNAKTNAAKYSYKVSVNRVVGKKTYASADSAAKTGYYMSAPSGLTLKNSSAKAIKVSYKKNTKASGYEIRYSLKSNMSGAKSTKLSGNTKVSKTFTKLTKNKKYYVSVRSYKKVGSTTYYSAWSSAKNLVVKK